MYIYILYIAYNLNELRDTENCFKKFKLVITDTSTLLKIKILFSLQENI